MQFFFNFSMKVNYVYMILLIKAHIRQIIRLIDFI